VTAYSPAGGSSTPADGSITLAKMANLAQDTMIGRAAASTGVPEAITLTAAGRALNDDASASAQRTTLGLNTLTADSDGSTITFDLAASPKHGVTIQDNRTLALSNPTTGQSFSLRITQGTGGSKTVTWFSTIRWAGGGTPPTLTTAEGKADWFGFVCTGSGTYDGFVLGQNL